ncbi:hypothetical protein COU54_02610 [Candidatus Pacearchaeota archaeon CG10_big_fil_rev_8_21_14_0_10_31_24]|nr:MAG: hypothetical protein COU54_02610 [Candidatus Pacearchaeota archaeon CG10_big_fil_rev_8_21_14_0_10_31_24]
MFKIKKRKKSTRYRGSQTHKRGSPNRTRSRGSSGGQGMAGTGKRGDQKKSLVINQFGNNYFGKSKTLRRGKAPIRLEVINLGDIEKRIPGLTAKKLVTESKGNYEIDLTGYKLLGTGELKIKAKITASAASNSAIESLKKSKIELIIKSSSEEDESEERSKDKESEKPKSFKEFKEDKKESTPKTVKKAKK